MGWRKGEGGMGRWQIEGAPRGKEMGQGRSERTENEDESEGDADDYTGRGGIPRAAA
jgi:hypothetical protein